MQVNYSDIISNKVSLFSLFLSLSLSLFLSLSLSNSFSFSFFLLISLSLSLYFSFSFSFSLTRSVETLPSAVWVQDCHPQGADQSWSYWYWSLYMDTGSFAWTSELSECHYYPLTSSTVLAESVMSEPVEREPEREKERERDIYIERER